MPAKKILICADYPTPDKPVTGGIPRSVYSVAQDLKKIEPDTEFHICTLNESVKKSMVISKDNLFIHYIRFPCKNMPILVPKQWYYAKVRNIIQDIQPDLVHAHGTGKDYANTAIKWNPALSVITVHGVIQHESRHWTGLKGNYHRITGCQMEREILQKARNLIVVSPYVERSIRVQTSADITVIFNPVERVFTTVKKDEVPHRLLFVGGIEERKGLEVLIRALETIKKVIPEVELHIVGGIRKIVYYQKMLSLIKSLDLEQNIRFLGSLPEKELLREYSEAAVFVLPSFEESQGIVILEAMATGTPVVATRAGGIPDMISDGVNGLLADCGDDTQLYAAIVSLLQDKEQRKKLGQAGKQSALQYLPEIIARQHLDVYNRILSQVSW